MEDPKLGRDTNRKFRRKIANESPLRRLLSEYSGILPSLPLFRSGTYGGRSRIKGETIPAEIRIGLTTSGRNGRQFASATTLAFAHVNGLIEQAFGGTWTRIRWIFFEGAGPAIVRAIADGELDFAVQGDLPAVVARSKGLRTRLLLTAQLRRLSLAVPADSPIKSLADLRGHTIANNEGTALELAIIRILSEAKLTQHDVSLVNMNMATAMAALASHQIDAALISVDGDGLQEKGLVKLAYGSDLESARLASVSGFFVMEDFANRYPGSVNKVVRAIIEAAHWACEPQNRDAAFETWAQSGHPSAAFKKMYGEKPLKRYLNPLLDDFAIARFEAAASDALRFGLIERAVDIGSWIDRKPLRAALSALDLETYWNAYDRDGDLAPRLNPV